MIYIVTGQELLFEESWIKKASMQDVEKYFLNKDIIEVDTETERCPWGKLPAKGRVKKVDKEDFTRKDRLPDPYTSKVLCIQLGDRQNQFVIECATVNFIPITKKLLEDSTKLKIFTNAFFDLRFIFHWGINIKNICDIFLQEMILTRGLSVKILGRGYRSLGGMCDRYLGVHLNKEIRGQIHWRGLDPTVVKYAAEDVTYQNDIRLIQEEKLRELNLYRYADLENRYVISLARTSYRGFGIDSQKWLKVEEENNKILLKYQEELDNWVINNQPKYSETTLFDKRCLIKWTSSDQVKPLMKDLGINIETRDKKTGEDKESVEIKLLQKQINKSELIPIYIRYKELKKEITTYGSAFLEQNLNPITKRVHSEFFQILETGRISSTKPNIQNIPGMLEEDTHPLRLAFTPKEGNIFVVCDYSQQEPRITADYCQDPYLIDFITNGDGDSHSLISTMISEYLLGEEIKVSKHNNPFVPSFNKTIRAIGKMINLGLDYGKSAFSVKDDLNTTQEEAQRLIDIIKSKTPLKQKYFETWQRFVEENGYIVTDDLVFSRTWFEKYDRYSELKVIPYDKKTRKEVKEFYKLKGQMERFAQNNRIQGRWLWINSFNCWNAVMPISSQDCQE